MRQQQTTTCSLCNTTQCFKEENTDPSLYDTHTYTHTQPFYGPLRCCLGLPRWAGTWKVKPIWIYWSERCWVAVAGQYANLHLDPGTNMPASRHSIFYRPNALPATQPTVSKHWRQAYDTAVINIYCWLPTSTVASRHVHSSKLKGTVSCVSVWPIFSLYIIFLKAQPCLGYSLWGAIRLFSPFMFLTH